MAKGVLEISTATFMSAGASNANNSPIGMRRFLPAFLLAVLCQIGSAQDVHFQTGQTNDILKVKFSPDDRKLISYSAGDGWLCYWDVKTSQLLWKSKTEFIRKAEERANLEQFGWNEDQTLVYSKSQNGTFQTWNANTGRILSVSEATPTESAFAEFGKNISVTKDYVNFYLTNSETNQKTTIKAFSRTGIVIGLVGLFHLFMTAPFGGWWKSLVTHAFWYLRLVHSRDQARSTESRSGEEQLKDADAAVSIVNNKIEQSCIAISRLFPCLFIAVLLCTRDEPASCSE